MNASEPELRLLSRREAARACGLGQRTVDRLIARRELKVVRIGSRVLVPAAELARYLASLPARTPR